MSRSASKQTNNIDYVHLKTTDLMLVFLEFFCDCMQPYLHPVLLHYLQWELDRHETHRLRSCLVHLQHKFNIELKDQATLNAKQLHSNLERRLLQQFLSQDLLQVHLELLLEQLQ